MDEPWVLPVGAVNTQICEMRIVSSEVVFPKLGFSMDEGVIAEWLVADGAAIKEGQPIYVVESDKSTQEIESPASGTLKIIGRVGEVYKVGTVIGEVS